MTAERVARVLFGLAAVLAAYSAYEIDALVRCRRASRDTWRQR